MSELLPCPFCGGEAEIVSSGDGFTSIGCLVCNPLFGIMLQKTSRAEAIAAWNTRAGRTCRIEKQRGEWVCSACGELVGSLDPWSELYVGGYMMQGWNYCPNCGKVVCE